jgi:hypothetical protein
MSIPTFFIGSNLFHALDNFLNKELKKNFLQLLNSEGEVRGLREGLVGVLGEEQVRQIRAFDDVIADMNNMRYSALGW